MSYSSFYDQMIDWNKRLKREGPKLLELVREVDARRVLDLACGTGEHALFLAATGLSVTGVDLSPELIAIAKEKAASRKLPTRFLVGGFDEVPSFIHPPQDLILCIGNSLPHLTSHESVVGALHAMSEALRPGGGLFIQIRNYHRVMDNKERFMPLNWSTEGETERLFLRMMDFLPDGQLDFNILQFVREEGGWRMERQVERLRPIFQEELEELLLDLGFAVEVFGDYERHPFQPEQSPDLILWAKKNEHQSF